jgi:phosphatidate phosphatase APP1
VPIRGPNRRTVARRAPRFSTLARLARHGRNLLWLLARPVRRARRERDLVIQPYRGFGSPERILLIGRVLRQPKGPAPRDRLARDAVDVVRRLFRRGVPGAAVEAVLGEARAGGRTDRDGYFQFELDLEDAPLERGGWHHVDVRLVGRPEVTVMARVLVHARATRCVVVSDIDDTVVETGVANRLVMLWRLFVGGPTARLPVPGVADLYRALNRGPDGGERNPVVFVSRAPWTIYETLDAFFRLQGMPRDAVLFLREWGVRWHHPFARHEPEHKSRLIRRVLAVTPTLPVVLVGDSGQEDAETYARIVQDYPGRVRCVLIRDLARSPERERAIRALERRLDRAGARLVLSPSTADMAQVIRELGLIAPQAVGRVAAAAG